MTKTRMVDKEKARSFTDRESGTYGGLVLCLREFRDRLDLHPSYQLNRKPREVDCLIIDKLDSGEKLDNSIARIFSKHNTLTF